MPAKRKPSKSNQPKSAKAAKIDEQTSIVPIPAVKASSYENRPVPTPTIADGWPTGIDGWKRVLKTRQFYSLLRSNTTASWKAGIRLVMESKTGDIDCRFLPHAKPVRTWLRGGRKPEPETETVQAFQLIPPQVVYDMYNAVCCAIGITGAVEPIARQLIRQSDLTYEAVDSLPKLLMAAITVGVDTGHIVPICQELRRYNLYPDRNCILAAILDPNLRMPLIDEQKLSNMLIDPDGMACQLIRMLPTDGRSGMYELFNTSPTMLQTAWKFGAENVVRALLEHLPVVDLDVAKPETKQDDYAIRRLVGDGRRRMTVYRRDRADLVRQVLADLLPFDVFGLIDAYNEACDRRDRISDNRTVEQIVSFVDFPDVDGDRSDSDSSDDDL